MANLSVALVEAVSAREECDARSLVELPPQLWTGTPRRLAPGWKGILDEYKATIAPFIANQTIVGIFMGDELVCAGMAVSNFTAVSSALRTEFGPSLLLYTNECSGGLNQMSASDLAYLDLFSIDIYDNRNEDGVRLDSRPVISVPSVSPDWHVPTQVAEVRAAREIYEKSIFSKLAPHQKVILVPGVFGNTPEGCAAHNLSCPLDEQETQIVLKLDAYFEWAKAEPRIVGFNPYATNILAYILFSLFIR